MPAGWNIRGRFRGDYMLGEGALDKCFVISFQERIEIASHLTSI